MTYDAKETGAETGEPIYMYQFVFGTSSYDLTNSQVSFSFRGVTYTPLSITHTQPKASGDDVTEQITITLPLSHEIPQKFINSVPGRMGTVTVRRSHYSEIGGDEEEIVSFDGLVSSMDIVSPVEARLLCRPKTQFYDRTGPAVHYSTQCPYVWGDGNCKVARTSYKYDGTVSATANGEFEITVNGISANGADWAVGGYVEYPIGTEQELRLVLAQDGDDLTLLMPFANSVSGEDVRVFAGCDHSIDHCNSKFSNALNFGGFPYVPIIGPYGRILKARRQFK